MKKNIISFIISSMIFSHFAKAQQVYTAEATLSPSGQVLKVTDASGRVTTISAATTGEIQNQYLKLLQKPETNITSPGKTGGQLSSQLFIPHQAVLLKDGRQEIRWTDPAGKERVVTAAIGESIQQKYLAYLKKEGLPCGCTPPENSAAVSSPQARTLTATKPNAQEK